MAKSNKAFFWSLFAAGGTLAAFIVPVVTLLILLTALGYPPSVMQYENMYAFASHILGKIAIFGTLILLMWHSAHRLRVTAHDFGIRADSIVAACCYGLAALGSIWLGVVLLKI